MFSALRSQEMSLPASAGAVIFNWEASSYFKVRYDAASFCKVVAILRNNHTNIPIVERAQLLDDQAPLAMPNPNCRPCGIAAWFHMQEYLKKERDYIPWRIALNHLERLRKMLAGPLMGTRFTRWMDNLVQTYFDHRGYGMERENTENQMRLKRRMVDYACNRADTAFSLPCREEALAQVKVWMKSNSSKNPISPFLRNAFYKVVWIEASMEGNSEVVDSFLKKYEEAKTMRFMRQEHFMQLKEAYDMYTIIASDSEEAGIIKGGEASQRGLEMEIFCSTIVDDKFSSDLPEVGHKTLRKCWHKIKESEKAVKIVKELVGEVVLGNEVESLEKWAREENVREDVRQAVEEITDKAKAQLKCAGMVARTLDKLLPE